MTSRNPPTWPAPLPLPPQTTTRCYCEGRPTRCGRCDLARLLERAQNGEGVRLPGPVAAPSRPPGK